MSSLEIFEGQKNHPENASFLSCNKAFFFRDDGIFHNPLIFGRNYGILLGGNRWQKGEVGETSLKFFMTRKETSQAWDFPGLAPASGQATPRRFKVYQVVEG